MLILCLAILADGQEALPRYRIQWYHPFLFGRFDTLPFVELRPMNHASDIEYLEGQDFTIWYELDDYLTGAAGLVASVEYGNERYCLLWWWQDVFGEDGNPHPAYEAWIDCATIEMFDPTGREAE